MNFVPITAYERQKAEWDCYLSERLYKKEHQLEANSLLPENFRI